MIYQGKLEYVIVDRSDTSTSILDLRSGKVKVKELNGFLENEFGIKQKANRDASEYCLADILCSTDITVFDRCMVVTDSTILYHKWGKLGFELVPLGMGVVDNVPYVLEELDDHTAESLESVFLRLKGLPWHIARTDRILIREITLDDVPKLYDIYSDTRVAEFVEPLYEDIKDELEYTAKYIENCYAFYEYGTWILESTITGEIIGRAGLEPLEDRIELGYIIAGDYQGQGLATECCTCIMELAKELLPEEKLWARCHVDNFVSQKILGKLGFLEIKEKRDGNILWYTTN